MRNTQKRVFSMPTSASHNCNDDHELGSYSHMIKECMSDSVTNYNYEGDTKISASIKTLMPTNAH